MNKTMTETILMLEDRVERLERVLREIASGMAEGASDVSGWARPSYDIIIIDDPPPSTPPSSERMAEALAEIRERMERWWIDG